jgi:heme-degrading monooxygenase HmoA
MSATADPSRRTAAAPDPQHAGPVTLINSFVVAAGRDAAFQRLWTDTSGYFRAQPGFVSLRLHRALAAGAPYRWVNVAVWASARQFADAHATPEFRRLVSRPEWQEFPSSPALYEVAVAYPAETAADIVSP